MKGKTLEILSTIRDIKQKYYDSIVNGSCYLKHVYQSQLKTRPQATLNHFKSLQRQYRPCFKNEGRELVKGEHPECFN